MKKSKLAGAMGLLACVAYFSFSSLNVKAAEQADKPCYCLDIYAPVCIIATGQQFSNACQAQCAGYTPAEYTDCYAQ